MINTAKDCDVPPTRGTLHDSELRRFHGPQESDWWRNANLEHRIRCQSPVRWPSFFGASAARSVLLSFRAMNVWLEMHWESIEYRVDDSRSYWSDCRSWFTSIWPGKSYDFKFVAFTDTNRVWSGRISWLPRVSRIWQWTWVIASAWRSGATFTSSTSWAPKRFWIKT